MNPLCEREFRRGTSAPRLGWGRSRAEIAGRKAAPPRAQAWLGRQADASWSRRLPRDEGGEKAAVIWVLPAEENVLKGSTAELCQPRKPRGSHQHFPAGGRLCTAWGGERKG